MPFTPFPWKNKGEPSPTKLNRQNLNAAEEAMVTGIGNGEIALPGAVVGGAQYGVISATKFGLKQADTAAQNYTHIAEAIAECAAEGLELVLPPWEIKLNKGLILPSNLHMRGFGLSTILKGEYEVATGSIIQNNYTLATSNIHLRNFAIDRRGNNAQHGMGFRQVTHLDLEWLFFLGSNHEVITGGALHVGGFASPAETDTCYDAHARHIYCLQSDNFAVQFGAVIGGSIKNCLIQEGYRECIGVEPGSGLVARGIALEGNVVRGGSIKSAGSTSTGLFVVTGTSGGTVEGVTSVGNVVDQETVIAGDTSPGFGFYGLGERALTSVGDTALNTNGSGFMVGNSNASPSGACVGVTLVAPTVVNPNKGANAAPNGAGIGLRNATLCKVMGPTVRGPVTGGCIEESGGGKENHIMSGDLTGTVSGTPTPFATGTPASGTTVMDIKKEGSDATINVWSAMQFIDGKNVVFGTGTGTELGTGPTQKMAFWGGTRDVQPPQTEDLKKALVHMGLVGSAAGATPLNLNGGILTSPNALKPTEAQYETISRAQSLASQAALTSERLFLSSIWLPESITVSSIYFSTGGTAAVKPTHYWFALFDNARKALAFTADQTTAAWGSTAGKKLAIATIASGAASSFTTTYTGFYYLGIMVAAETVPTIEGVSPGNVAIAEVAPILCGNSTTAQTTVPAFPFTAASITFINSLLYGFVA